MRKLLVVITFMLFATAMHQAEYVSQYDNSVCAVQSCVEGAVYGR